MPVKGSLSADLRFDPIEQKFVPSLITAEPHIVAEIPELPGKYGIRLREFPLRPDDPSTMIIADPSVIITGFNVTSGDPSPSEIRPDYFFDDGNNPSRTSHVFFHEDNVGLAVTVRYYGGGSSNSIRNQQLLISGNFSSIQVSALEDVEWALDTIEQRVLIVNDLTISDDTTLKCNTLIVRGDFSLATGKVLTIEPIARQAGERTHRFFPGGTASAGAGGDSQPDGNQGEPGEDGLTLS